MFEDDDFFDGYDMLDPDERNFAEGGVGSVMCLLVDRIHVETPKAYGIKDDRDTVHWLPKSEVEVERWIEDDEVLGWRFIVPRWLANRKEGLDFLEY
jgi:hypothetical protein